MEGLKSEKDRLCVWLSKDPDYIVDRCGDILLMNQFKEVQKQTSALEKIRVLLEIIINTGGDACQSFMDILQRSQDHYTDLRQFFNNSAQGSITPTVVSDKGSVVSMNVLKDTRGKSLCNKIEIVNTPGALSGPSDGQVPQASHVATGGSVILADRLCGVTVDGEINFSASVKTPGACKGTDKEAEPAPQGPAVKMITEHKTDLMHCLMGDLVILQYAQVRGVINDLQYHNLKHTSPPARAVTDLLDVVIGRGQEICATFLEVLREPDILDTYPDLKNILDIK